MNSPLDGHTARRRPAPTLGAAESVGSKLAGRQRSIGSTAPAKFAMVLGGPRTDSVGAGRRLAAWPSSGEFIRSALLRSALSPTGIRSHNNRFIRRALAAASLAVLTVTLMACQPSPQPRGTPAAASVTATPAAPVAAIGPAQQVGEFAFVPGSRDLVYSTFGQSADGPGLYIQRWDEAAGGPSATAEPFARLPSPARFIESVASGDSGPLAALARTAPEPPTDENDLWLVDADGTVRGANIGAFMPHQITLAPDGESVIVLTGDGRLLAHDLATGADRPLADGLFGTSGAPGARVAVSPDGSWVALARQTFSSADSGMTLERIDLADAQRKTLLELAAPLGIDNMAFDPDDGALYYITSKSIVGGPKDLGNSFESILYRLAPTAGAKPERIGAIVEMIGRKNLAGGLTVAPGGQVVLVQNDTIYTIDPAVASARAITPPEESVYGAPLLTTVDGKTWVAYLVERHPPDGSESLFELRVRPLE
jgi:hypothetical protein